MTTVPPSVATSIADALNVGPELIGPETKASDIDAWDSMGTMSILLALETDFGLRLAPGQTAQLQSVPGIVQLLSDAGKL